MKNKKLKGGNDLKLASIASLLLIILLTSGVFAVSNTDTTAGSSGNTLSETTYSPPSLTTAGKSPGEAPPRVSISLDPRKQTSANGEATYKVIVKALYLPDTDALRASEYKLEFEPEDQDIQGSFSTENFSLHPGEKVTIELNVKAENSGEHNFVVKVSDENGNEAESKGLLSALDSNTESSQKIKLDLQPEKQYAENGSSEYTLTVSRPLETSCYNNVACTSIYSGQEYGLTFVSEQESLSGEFKSSNSVSLRPGEKISVPLEITAKEKGTYVFKVYAKALNYETNVKGLLVYGKEPQEPQTPPTSSSPYLNGEGFATNEDQSEGVLIYLHLLGSDQQVRGKMVFGESSYALKGQISNSGTDVDFSLYNPEDGGFNESIGEFHGEIQKFNTFMILKGSADFKTNSYPDKFWTLTVIGKQDSVFKNEIVVPQSNAPVTKTISQEQVVTIRQNYQLNSNDSNGTGSGEAYIVPGKIERKKVFGIIPNPWGDKILKVKLVENSTTTEQDVAEFGTNKIGNYEVSIGSLENENAIEVSVTKAEQIKLN